MTLNNFFEKCGKFNNMHMEWYDLVLCYAEYDFCLSNEIDVCESVPFPQILFTSPGSYKAAKAHLFATMLETHGLAKMIEWLETVDLLYYFECVFGVGYNRYIEPHDISYYRQILRGETNAKDEAMRLALWVDDKYKAHCELEVFHSCTAVTKAVIKFGNSVLGIVNIRGENITSYVTDYTAWERRRAEGYTRNNPYNETEFMERVLAYSPKNAPRILEIGIGGGRKAKPFVKRGLEYHGIDISDGMLSECKTVLGEYPNLHIKKHDIYDGLPYEDNFFDIVIECRGNTGTTKNPYIMSEISRVLRPEGVAFLDIGDNMELPAQQSPLYMAQGVALRDFEATYLESYNLNAKRATYDQRQYGLGLPTLPMKTSPSSDFVIPEPVEVFTPERPFSTYTYNYDYVHTCRDNKFHMAFWRTEPMFEPAGTNFFHAMEQMAREIFGSEIGLCTRVTELKIYRF